MRANIFGDTLSDTMVPSKCKRPKDGTLDSESELDSSEDELENEANESEAETDTSEVEDEWIVSFSYGITTGDDVDLSSPILRGVFAEFEPPSAPCKVVVPSQQAGSLKKQADWGFN
ncbi:hypothetical protein BDN71DRAFT_1501386 [Pleurotus eryngii]|uniref:Uncharacterized protein n=1 Tax=Pleurotus eryngii TaxID=5323 RepID=A0A9P6DC17_PLEER|nr:hypothetical protein BDN71DRAFT_1501386 [Pleurotus eryngii]